MVLTQFQFSITVLLDIYKWQISSSLRPDWIQRQGHLAISGLTLPITNSIRDHPSGPIFSCHFWTNRISIGNHPTGPFRGFPPSTQVDPAPEFVGSWHLVVWCIDLPPELWEPSQLDLPNTSQRSTTSPLGHRLVEANCKHESTRRLSSGAAIRFVEIPPLIQDRGWVLYDVASSYLGGFFWSPLPDLPAIQAENRAFGPIIYHWQRFERCLGGKQICLCRGYVQYRNAFFSMQYGKKNVENDVEWFQISDCFQSI